MLATMTSNIATMVRVKMVVMMIMVMMIVVTLLVISIADTVTIVVGVILLAKVHVVGCCIVRWHKMAEIFLKCEQRILLAVAQLR